MMRLLKALLVALWVITGNLSRPVREPLDGESRPGEPHASDAGTAQGGFWLWLRRGALLGILLALGGFAVAASGIIPIKASSGHWAITAWFLNFSMSRSVSTHTIGMQVPPLEERLVLKGAGHYDTGCRPCHGAPALHHPRIAQAMTPHPPYLPETLHEWDPEELFYIVKHGVKFTGMPAWPSQHRDDEVWAVVAFLQRYPELDAAEYQQLVSGSTDEAGDTPPLEGLVPPELAGQEDDATTEIPASVADSCARCHGWRGEGRGAGVFPRLAGQRPLYLQASLEAFASGSRHSGIMEPISAGLSPTEIKRLARYYSQFDDASPPPDPVSPDRVPSAEAIARGAAIAEFGIPSEKVAACRHCHGPTEHPRNPLYPELAGQYAEYLELQLELFKQGNRGGTEYSHIMHEVAARLTAAQMHDVAAYYQSLGSGLQAARSGARELMPR